MPTPDGSRHFDAATPLLLLDIDGVLSPLFYHGDLLAEGYTVLRGSWNNAFLATRERDWIERLRPYCALVWATNWRNAAHEVTDHWNIEKFPLTVEFDDMFDAEGTWKLPAIQRFLEGRNNPVVWIDDELEDDAIQWARTRPHTHFLQANPTYGLMDDALRNEASRIILAYKQ